MCELATRHLPNAWSRRAPLPGPSTSCQESELLIALAPHLEDFLGGLFGIEKDLRAQAESKNRLAPLFACKRLFVQRQAIKTYKEAEAESFDGDALRAALEKRLGGAFDELSFARQVMAWREDETANAENLGLAEKYAAWATLSAKGKARHKHGVLFKTPHKLDQMHLVPVETGKVDGVDILRLPESKLRRREGFKLTDSGMDETHTLDNAHYCIYCHNQGKNSCSKGFREKAGGFRKSVFGVTLNGCPLEEKISEMNLLFGEGHALGCDVGRDRRQSDAGGHGAPHLQRLHEILHLSEARTGRYSSDRNPRLARFAGAALGLRDLWAVDPLEPAQSAAAGDEARFGLQGFGRGPRPCRLHAGASSDE